MLDYLAPVPPWLLLSTTIGTLLGAVACVVLPKYTPGLLLTCVLLIAGLVLGHLVAVVADLPTPRVGEFRLLYGLILGCLLVWLAKANRL